MKNIALLIAGGSGNRMHQDIPKQFITVHERPVIVYTMEAFQNHPEIDAIAVVCIEGWEQVLLAYAKQFNITKLQYVVKGGKKVAIPLLDKDGNMIDDKDAVRRIKVKAEWKVGELSEKPDCIAKTRKYGDAITAIPCAEAMMQTEDGATSCGSYPRDNLKRTQTPQGFSIGKICDLHRRALEAGITNSVASCTLMIEMGEQVHFSAGSEKNIKLTTVEDIDIFKALLKQRRSDWLK